MLARIRKSMEEKDQGFTLIELLVVMIIIGILAAIAIPVFLNQRKKAVDSGIRADLRTVANEMETYFVDNQTYPAAADFAASSTTTQNVKIGPTASATTVPVSKGNVITRVSADAAAFCLKGTNANGSKDFWYDSDGGGLVTSACT